MTDTWPPFFTDIIERVCAIVDPYFLPNNSSEDATGMEQAVKSQPQRFEPYGLLMPSTGYIYEQDKRNQKPLPRTARKA